MPNPERIFLIDPIPYFFKVDVLITPDMIDAYGHVNNSEYFRICEKQRDLYTQAIGGSLEGLRKRGLGGYVRDGQHSFKVPLVSGEHVLLHTGAAAKRVNLVFNHEMYNMDGKFVFYYDCIIPIVDLSSGRSTRVPEDISQLISNAKFS